MYVLADLEWVENKQGKVSGKFAHYLAIFPLFVLAKSEYWEFFGTVPFVK